MDRRRIQRLPGECTRCHQVFPLTEEFFYLCRRRGRCEWRQKCKQCVATKQREYGKENVEAVSAYNKRRAKTPRHRAIMRAAWTRYRAKPEHKEIERSQYRRKVSTVDGREKVRVKIRRRRARVRGSTRHHTAEDVRCAVEAQGGLCFYCHIDVSTKYTVDHLIPLVRGGSDGPENIVIACASCNFRKSDKTPEEFVAGITHRRLAWRSGLLG
jgi:5-methylcytosine-specific restriction endonuclease McrA